MSERTIERWKLAEATSAPRSTSSTVTARRSAPGTSEQASVESACGSIGSTAPGTYTLVARRRASRSKQRVGGHVGRDVGDMHPHAHRDPIRHTFRGDRVVEVACGGGIDGEGGQLAQVEPPP